MKVAWDTLVRCYNGDASVKKVKLQFLCKQYKNLSIKNNEKVLDYIFIVILIINKMKSCGETLSEESNIEKILRSLTPHLDYIVVAIEHSKDLSTVRIKELQISIEAQELRLTERTSEREVEQTLKASFVKKDQKQSWSEAKKRHGRSQKSETSTSGSQKGKEKYDKRKVQCYCCKKFGHFAADYWSNKERKSKEPNITRSYDDEHVLLMNSGSNSVSLED
ncbi:uncharacterized protein LOC127136196 [Lathyrus oleraceus]|uniref:uncharacterized protein LOC127136196 n=1 Tax=Pisum sativum TaxID=3888 RepID=UPI0021D08F4A|nr:uncharacterized protein LOC127136196 [Pisum sativum]